MSWHDIHDLIARIVAVNFETWVAISFVPIAVCFVIALWLADIHGDSAFKFVHFVTADTGRGSPFALGYTVLVIVCAWGVWALIVLNRLTEWYMTLIIGGFVVGALGGRAAQVMARMKGAVEPPPTAGDVDAPPAPLVTQQTQTTTTVTVPQDAPLPDALPPKPQPIGRA